MPPLKTNGGPGAPSRSFWRSMDDLADSPEFRRFLEAEFPGLADPALPAPSRRGFLKIMGASLALAGMTGCRWPKEEIHPFAQRPEGYTPGEPLRFATAMDLGGAATGLLVTSYDGRPIKIEGNPEHWQSLGATHAWHQASILELYDPDRSQNVVERDGGVRGWEDFVSFARGRFAASAADGGRGLRVLAEPSSSPSREAMRARLLAAFPQARWYEYAAVSRDNAREGAKLAFGGAHRTHVALDRAETIVALDEDFLLHHPAAVRYARDFAAGRDPRGRFSRLWVVESAFSVTGAAADRRVALSPSEIPAFAVSLAAALVARGLELPSAAADLRGALDGARSSAVHARPEVAALAAELLGRRGASVLLAGPSQPGEVHALLHLLNAALGNVGNTVTYTAEPDGDRPAHDAAIRALADEARAGQVETLLILGGNPVYDAPAGADFAAALSGVPTSIHCSVYRNETSRACSWHLPRAHWLESWGDARDWRGSVSVVQPLIQPLYGARSDIELLALLVGEPPFTGHEIVRRTFFSGSAGVPGEAGWIRALHDGVVPGTEWALAAPALASAGWAAGLEAALRGAEGAAGRLELVFVEDASVGDGRFANNGWLQELPDPLTKLTWDNAALIAPETARELGVWHGERVRVAAGEAAVELPVFILPGQAPRTIGVALGYGRSAAGRVGDGRGFDVYPLRPAAGAGWVEASAEKAPGTYALSTTQDHFAIDRLGDEQRRERAAVLAREADLEHYREDPHHALAHAAHPPVELYSGPEYDGHRWGMAIDLNTCIGCNACVVACQAENNIPVVGKDEVGRGREMHWLRIDRYFTGDPAEPAVTHQPVTCQHCENAPCEQVCPVAATVHDRDGLNVMVYNRCVGTRYCSNNCPYKVRRFNYFNHHTHEEPPASMAYNPEVTLRFRGVMEKCTFCVQRISAAKILAKNERRPVADGEVVPACAQACPTRAISFGDLNDEASLVAGRHRDDRAYSMLEEINVRPRTRYLARLRNPGERSGDGHEGAA